MNATCRCKLLVERLTHHIKSCSTRSLFKATLSLLHVNYVANVHNKILFIELYRIAWQEINYDSARIQPVVSLMGFAKQLNQFSMGSS